MIEVSITYLDDKWHSIRTNIRRDISDSFTDLLDSDPFMIQNMSLTKLANTFNAPNEFYQTDITVDILSDGMSISQLSINGISSLVIKRLMALYSLALYFKLAQSTYIVNSHGSKMNSITFKHPKEMIGDCSIMVGNEKEALVMINTNAIVLAQPKFLDDCLLLVIGERIYQLVTYGANVLLQLEIPLVSPDDLNSSFVCSNIRKNSMSKFIR